MKNFLDKKNKQRGASVLEYLLVTTFTLITGLATLHYVGGIVKEKIQNISEKFSEESEDLDFSSSNPE